VAEGAAAGVAVVRRARCASLAAAVAAATVPSSSSSISSAATMAARTAATAAREILLRVSSGPRKKNHKKGRCSKYSLGGNCDYLGRSQHNGHRFLESIIGNALNLVPSAAGMLRTSLVRAAMFRTGRETLDARAAPTGGRADSAARELLLGLLVLAIRRSSSRVALQAPARRRQGRRTTISSGSDVRHIFLISESTPRWIRTTTMMVAMVMVMVRGGHDGDTNFGELLALR
jgi:hypothetical protein